MTVAVLWLPVVLLGCSGAKIADTDVEKGVYASEDVDRFVHDTATRAHAVLVDEYVIGVGDLLDVVFLLHSNLSTRELVVRRDGRISLPYVGDVDAAGLTPMVLDSVLTEEFSEILREPNVAVIVRKPAPQKVFVLGDVESPGRFEFDDELSVVQSIAMAGGMSNSASQSHAILIRRQGLNRIVGVEIDVKGILVGAEIHNDIRLRNYDIVYVPRRPIYSVADFMQELNDIVLPPLDWTLRALSIRNLDATYDFLRAGSNPVITP